MADSSNPEAKSKPVATKSLPLWCWLTRHHWLLQAEQPISYYAENDAIAESWLYYECQRCGKIERSHVTNLDNLPEGNDLQLKDPDTNTKGNSEAQ